jgi:hypothetical protein
MRSISLGPSPHTIAAKWPVQGIDDEEANGYSETIHDSLT